MRLKLLRGIASTAGIGLALLLCGWTTDWAQVRRDAQAVRTLQATFTQEKHLPILSRPLVSKGRLLFRSPDAVRWEYASPVRSVLILHGGIVKRYLPGPAGMIESSGAETAAMGPVLRDMTAWFRGDFEGNPYFTASFSPQPVPRILLKPRGEALASMIQGIEVTLSPTPGVIESVRIREGEGAYTLYRFSQVQVNRPLEDRQLLELS